MSEIYSYKDKYGSYTLQIKGRVLLGTTAGLVGTKLAMNFVKSHLICTAKLASQPWGYFGDLSGCEGYTGEALDIMSEAFKDGVEHGAVVDAYLINSPLMIDQIEKMRTSAGASSPIKKRIFATPEECMSFIHTTLRKEPARI